MIVDVDITSLHGVTQALTSKNPSNWALANYYEVATALLQMDEVRVPEPSGSPRPIQEHFGTNTSYRRTHKRQALMCSQNIDQEMLDRIKDAVVSVWPSPQYEGWLDWHVEKEWQEHITRLRGLVQAENIPQIAKKPECHGGNEAQG
jgi:hypothetical protein